MATLIHFDEDDIFTEEWDSLGIGIGHRNDIAEESDNETMGIGIGHREESNK